MIVSMRRGALPKERGEKLKQTEEELAFYDALGVNEPALKIMGDAALRQIAQELAA